MPHSLAYKDAGTTASGVKAILTKSYLASVEVVKLVVKCSIGQPKLLLFNLHCNQVAKFHKDFTPILSLSITPLKTPYYGGMGALYFHLSSKDDHIAHPPPSFPANTGMTHINNSQLHKQIVALGTGGYSRAIADMIYKISTHCHDINIWNNKIDRLPKPTEGENPNITNKCKEFMD